MTLRETLKRAIVALTSEELDAPVVVAMYIQNAVRELRYAREALPSEAAPEPEPRGSSEQLDAARFVPGVKNNFGPVEKITRREWCRVAIPGKGGYLCTRDVGHSGPHRDADYMAPEEPAPAQPEPELFDDVRQRDPRPLDTPTPMGTDCPRHDHVVGRDGATCNVCHPITFTENPAPPAKPDDDIPF